MAIKVATGVNFFEAAKNAIKLIDPRSTNFVIVPDRATLQLEELVFDTLNLTSTLNIDVIGISNLAQRYLGQGDNLSQIESVLQTKKAIENCQGRLRFFKSANINFCMEIYKIISQFKSSGLSSGDIEVKSKKNSLNLKLSDLKIIFAEFESLTQDKTDPSTQIDDFAKLIEQTDIFDNAHFTFVGFDSFTAKHFELLSVLAKKARSLTIALPSPISKKNAYIFENDILRKLEKIASLLSATVEVVSPQCELEGESKVIAQNLFGKIDEEFPGDVTFFEAPSPKKECEYVAKAIAYEVFHGARYSDFQIAVSDLKSQANELALALERHKIPFYHDLSTNASETYSALLFQKMISFSLKGYRKNDLLFILNSPFFECDEKLISYVNEFYQGGAKNFYGLSVPSEIKDLLSEISQNHLLGAKKLVEFLESKAEVLAERLDQKTQDFEKQIPEALRQILDGVENCCELSDLKQFCYAIELALASKEISALPSFVDQVYVGDVADSFFGQSNILFVMGANAGLLPKAVCDNSIFSDEDLESANLKRKVEPTIKMINRRNRFKLFCVLTQFKKRLYVSFSSVGIDGKPASKSMVVSNLLELFGKNENEIVRNLYVKGDNSLDRLLFAIGRDRLSGEELSSDIRGSVFEKELKKALGIEDKKFSVERVLKSGSEHGLGECIKPTEIEKFYDCPFKVYCENVLKLKEKPKPELSPLQSGSIIHKAIELFGRKFNYKFSGEDTAKIVGEAISQCRQEVSDFDRKRLELDAEKVLKKISDELSRTKFSPWLIEEKIEAELDGVKITGRVDRVDKFENYFRVIDYKTGRISTKLIEELAFGKKLQLFAYSGMIRKKTGLICGGVYYFDAKGGYGQNARTTLSGLTEEGALELSEQINKKSSVTDQQMQELETEAINLLQRGVKHLQNGKVLPCPDESSCEFCRFKAICLYDYERGIRRHKGGEI